MLQTEAARPIDLSGKRVSRLYNFAPDDTGLNLDAVAERLKNVKEVGELVASFNRWSTKFKFGTTSRIVWERKYRFSESGATLDVDNVVNSSRLAVQAYVARVIEFAKQRQSPVLMLVGGVGSGKSSFNKYVTTHYHDEFKNAGVIASRVEFQKLRRHLESYPNIDRRKAAGAFIFATLLRDIALYIYGSEAFDDNEPFAFSSKCRLDRDADLINDSHELDLYELIDSIVGSSESPHYQHCGVSQAAVEKFYKQFSKYPTMLPPERAGFVAFWAKHFLLDHTDSRAMAAVSELFVARVLRVYRPFLILDGFDYIGVSDFEEGGLLSWTLDWLASSLVENGGLELPISCDKLRALVQITIRSSTNEIFWRNRAASHNQVNCVTYLVESPSVEAVVDGLSRMITHFTPSASGVGSVWCDMLNRSIVHLYERLRQPDDGGRCKFTSADLFQNNSRHLVNFLRDVFEIELDRAYKALAHRGVPLSGSTLANEMREHFDELIKHQSYALVQILLSSRSTRYQNFLSVSLGADGGILLEDNDNGSGYIGNVFNYHATYDLDEGLREFTHKLLILKLLCQDSSTRTVEEIADYICFDVGFTKLALRIMIRENMVEAIYQPQRRATLYRASKLGEIVLDHLIYELSYIESVFFGMNVPSAFIAPKLQDVHRSAPASSWVQGSLANATLVLRMMHTAGESAAALCGSDDLACVRERMTKSLDEAFGRIARSASGPPMLTPAEVDAIFDRQRKLLG